jgi:hypothetical protein
MSDHRNSSRANLPKMSATHKILFGCVLTAALLAFSFTSFHRVKDSTQDTTTAGVDGDKNGIRDEIDALIAKEYQESPAQTLAAQNLARIFQLEAQMGNPTKEEAVKLSHAESDLIGCLMGNSTVGKAASGASRLVAATFNNFNRIKNQEKLSMLVSGEEFTAKGKKGCK